MNIQAGAAEINQEQIKMFTSWIGLISEAFEDRLLFELASGWHTERWREAGRGQVRKLHVSEERLQMETLEQVHLNKDSSCRHTELFMFEQFSFQLQGLKLPF